MLKCEPFQEDLKAANIGLNFDDFWINISSKDPFGDSQKSAAAVTGYNLQIFNFIWN